MINEKYPTIREEARYYGLISENQLRQMQKRGELPGFFTGNTFRVNHAMLVELLEKKSRETIEKAKIMSLNVI